MSENPIECVKKVSGECIGWACQTCGALYTPRMFGQRDTSDGYCERMATECCLPKMCPGCGNELEKSRTRCWTCQIASSCLKEAAAYEAAPKLTLDEYLALHPDGMLSDGEEEFVSAGDEIPATANWAFVWCCEPVRGIKLDARDICEHQMEDRHEDAIEGLDLDGLQTLLDEWCAKQQTCSWFPGKHALHPDDVALLREHDDGDDPISEFTSFPENIASAIATEIIADESERAEAENLVPDGNDER